MSGMKRRFLELLGVTGGVGLLPRGAEAQVVAPLPPKAPAFPASTPQEQADDKAALTGQPTRSVERITATGAGIAQTMPAAETAASDGAAQYGQTCGACHQLTGQGVPGAFPPLAGNKIVQGDPHFLSRIVLYGLQGQVTVNGQTYNGAMPGFSTQLTDAQISQILTYIRGTWGNGASSVDPTVVAAERAKPGTPDDNYKNYPK